jgi:transposase-like protein
MNFDPKSTNESALILKPTNYSWRTDETYIKVEPLILWEKPLILCYLKKNPAYPPAIQELINEKSLAKETLIRQTKYLNNIVEQDHRFIKKITKPMLGFKSFLTADQTLKGIEALHLIRKGQADDNSTFLTAVEWLNKIFGLVA